MVNKAGSAPTRIRKAGLLGPGPKIKLNRRNATFTTLRSGEGDKGNKP
jgi:hypothetical protein